jgi:hypothetical protein
MKTQNYVYQATYWAVKADVGQQVVQLIAASTLRKALVKAEEFMDAAQMDGAELIALVKQENVVI